MNSLVPTLHFLYLSIFQPNLFSYGPLAALIPMCPATPFRDKDSVSHSKIQSVGWKIDMKLCVSFWKLFSIFLLEVCFPFLHLCQQFIKIQGPFTSITKGRHSQRIFYHKKTKVTYVNVYKIIFILWAHILAYSRPLLSFPWSDLEAFNSAYWNKYYVLLSTCKGNAGKFILIYVHLTLIVLIWRIGWAHNNARK